MEHRANGAHNQWSTESLGAQAFGAQPLEHRTNGAQGYLEHRANGAQGQPNIFSRLDLYFFHDRKNHIQSKLGFATIGNPTAISSGNHYNSIINDKRPWLHNPKILRLVRFQ